MKNITIAALLILVGIFGFLLIDRPQEPGVIKIGSIAALTGVGNVIGEEELNGALLAVEEINSKGGVHGSKLELVSEDVSLDKLKVAVSVARKLIEVDKVVAIVGPQWDEPAMPILPIIEEAQVPMIGADSSPDLEKEKSYEYFFSTWHDNRVGIRELLRFAEAKNIHRVAIIKPIAAGFWEFTARTMREEASKYGVEIVEEIDMGNPLSLDFKTPLLKLRAVNPEAIFAVTSDYNQCPFLTQADQMGFTGITLGTESSGDPASLGQCPKLMEKRFFSTPSKTTKYQAFADSFKSKFGTEPKYPTSVTAYDAVYVIARALEKTKLKGGIVLRNVIAETQYEGVSTPLITFNAKGFVSTPENGFEMQTVKDGSFVKLEN